MTCPNCGHNSDYPRVCPNCGHTKSNPGNRAAALAVLLILVLPCGGVGACLVNDGLYSPNREVRTMGSGLSVPFIFVCLLLLLWVRKLWKG